MKIKFGLDWMWISMLNNAARPTSTQAKSLLAKSTNRNYTLMLQDAISRNVQPCNNVELANIVVSGMRLFYKLPLEVDQEKLSQYLTQVESIATLLPLESKPVSIKHWSEFVVGSLPSSISRNFDYAIGITYPESYVWNALHYLASIPDTSEFASSQVFVHLVKHLSRIISCPICQIHLHKNYTSERQLLTNILTSQYSETPSDNVFISTCVFHNSINDINKRVPTNVCRLCSLGCSNRKFDSATALQAHRLIDYKQRLAEYREIYNLDETERLARLTS